MQEQALGERLGRHRSEAHAPAHRIEVVDVELQPRRVDAGRIVKRFALARREHQHVERRRVARQDAGVDEVLVDADRFGRAILGDRRGIGEVHAAEARKAHAAVLEVALPQSGLLEAHQDVPGPLEPQAPSHPGRGERHRKYAGHAGVVRAQSLEPGLELLRVGKGRVKNPLLAPPRVDLGAERERNGERGVAVTLGELAREQRAPIPAAHVGDVLLEEILFHDVGEHVEKALRGAGDVPGEFGDAFLAGLECAFLAQLAPFPRIGGDPVGGQVAKTFARHGATS